MVGSFRPSRDLLTVPWRSGHRCRRLLQEGLPPANRRYPRQHPSQDPQFIRKHPDRHRR
jgi:hypothetical protein